MHGRRVRAVLIVVSVLLAPANAGEIRAQGPAKRPITHDVYDSWRSIEAPALSPDGGWLAYGLVPQDGDGQLVVRNLRTSAEHRYPRGQAPAFTADGRFVLFAVAPRDEEVDSAKKAGKKGDELPRPGFGVMKVDTGEVFAADRVKSYKRPEDSSALVAYLLEPPPGEDGKNRAGGEKREKEQEPADRDKEAAKKKEPGTDLIVRDLANGTSVTIPGVSDYAWNKQGTWLVYAVSSRDGTADGVYARESRNGAASPILTGQGSYKALSFDEEGVQLAFVSDREDVPVRKPARFRLYHWKVGDRAARELAGPATPGMPESFAASEHGSVKFSKDGKALFFSVAPAPPPAVDGAPDGVKVDIWHYRDPFLQSMQRVRAENEKKRSYLAVVHVKDRRLVPLGSVELPEVEVSDGVEALLGSSDLPYRQLVSWDGRYWDFYAVGLRDGDRRKLVEKARFDAKLSPGGRYVLYFDADEQDWMSVRVADGRKANLTAALATPFGDEDNDRPEPAGAYGSAGWLEKDAAVLLYDRYDVWEVKPDGSGARNLTRGAGRAARVTFRYRPTDPDETAIPAGRPMLLSAVDERTKATGFYRLDPAGSATPEKLVMVDKALGNLQKAKEADVYVFTASRFDEFPDLWVSGPRFTDMKKVTDANPQQSSFNWGRAELIDYRNADGRVLSAVLVKPEDFDPSRKYPLMVYIYERLSDTLHRYVPPAPGHRINITRYVSNGYVVLMPDIVYDLGYPGASAYKCVIPAVQTVTAMGFIDPARIGIQGHSWGGYQASYLVTRTNMFRAVEAGASVANMTSAYGGIRWETGMSRAFQYEKTQSRIGGTPWEMTSRYLENSPIFWVDRVQTPYLTMHNDEDGAVPWYQGIEFFTALRRLGKEAYLFNYNGEKHGLAERDNQKHFTVHMAEFFDHYLLGAPKPEWMERGVPYLQRGARNLSAKP